MRTCSSSRCTPLTVEPNWEFTAEQFDAIARYEERVKSVFIAVRPHCVDPFRLRQAVITLAPNDWTEVEVNSLFARVLDKCAVECSTPHDRRAPEHVIVPIHGIRDYAEWYQTIQEAFDDGVFVVKGPRLGYVYLHRFLSPVDWSGAQRKRVVDHLRQIGMTNPDAPITVVAHSFGSHLIVRVLDENPDLRLHSLILCGAVVHQDSNWARISSQIGPETETDKSKYIINDCGDSDQWPAIGRAAGWRYGDAGTNGLRNAFVTDRFHEGGHSLYFNVDFMRSYWRPFVEHGTIVKGKGLQRAKLRWYWSFLAHVPLKLVPIAAGLLVLLLTLYIAYAASSVAAPEERASNTDVDAPPVRSTEDERARGTQHENNGAPATLVQEMDPELKATIEDRYGSGSIDQFNLAGPQLGSLEIHENIIVGQSFVVGRSGVLTAVIIKGLGVAPREGATTPIIRPMNALRAKLLRRLGDEKEFISGCEWKVEGRDLLEEWHLLLPSPQAVQSDDVFVVELSSGANHLDNTYRWTGSSDTYTHGAAAVNGEPGTRDMWFVTIVE